VLIEVLVRDQIEAGYRIMEVLKIGRFPVSAAFWCKIPEAGYWQLVIASPAVDQVGPLKAYGTLRDLLREIDFGYSLDVTKDVSLLSPADPGFLRLRAYALGNSRFGVGPATGLPRNLSFEDAFVYVA
jgi:hypothetical protein